MHDAWAGWTTYLLSTIPPGSNEVPEDKIKRWRYQIATPYSALPEAMKKSDRELADKLLARIEHLRLSSDEVDTAVETPRSSSFEIESRDRVTLVPTKIGIKRGPH